MLGMYTLTSRNDEKMYFFIKSQIPTYIKESNLHEPHYTILCINNKEYIVKESLNETLFRVIAALHESENIEGTDDYMEILLGLFNSMTGDEQNNIINDMIEDYDDYDDYDDDDALTNPKNDYKRNKHLNKKNPRYKRYNKNKRNYNVYE